jgi:ubiquitin C-terminal hydrolase
LVWIVSGSVHRNSVLQSLFSLPIFADYFEENRFSEEITHSTRGLVKSFADLLQKMRRKTASLGSWDHKPAQLNSFSWSGQGSNEIGSAGLKDQETQGKGPYEDPKAFKAKVAEIFPQFSGKNEEDALEFLVSLMEGISEELKEKRSGTNYKNMDYDILKTLEENVIFDTFFYHLE